MDSVNLPPVATAGEAAALPPTAAGVAAPVEMAMGLGRQHQVGVAAAGAAAAFSLSICVNPIIPFSPSRAITLPTSTTMFLDTITSWCLSPPTSSGRDSRGSCCASTDCCGGSGASTCSSGSCFASFAGVSSCGGGVDCGGDGGSVSHSAASTSSSDLPHSGWFAVIFSDCFSSNDHAITTEAIILNSSCCCSWIPCLC